jgi:ribosomal protein S18 acetylase RimI-like enzyme
VGTCHLPEGRSTLSSKMGATDVPFRFVLRVVALISLLLLQTTQTQALTSKSISIQPVQTAPDIAALAELRYNEWILPLPDDQSISRAAFAGATAEIIRERTATGAYATPFLARNKDRQPVGAAELSGVELEGVILSTDTSVKTSSISSILYVTDLVTSQAHRRQGIAQALMVALEETAVERGTVCLLLHVTPDNLGALTFYQSKLGYQEPTELQLEQWNLNLERLTENTDTQGQTLLCKELSVLSSTTTSRKQKNSSGAGFGGGGGGGTKQNKRAK